jgi:hypothetical protein
MDTLFVWQSITGEGYVNIDGQNFFFVTQMEAKLL